MKPAPTNPCAPYTRGQLKTRNSKLKTNKLPGQAAVIIGLSMLALLAVVGLAVDGGSLYGQRRTAQNAVDGAALAGARIMLDAYERMASGTSEDEDGTALQERDVRNAIVEYVGMNGVPTSTLQAYFVDDNKQLVTVSSGLGGCGTAEAPCVQSARTALSPGPSALKVSSLPPAPRQARSSSKSSAWTTSALPLRPPLSPASPPTAAPNS